jgi:hypothetical protein
LTDNPAVIAVPPTQVALAVQCVKSEQNSVAIGCQQAHIHSEPLAAILLVYHKNREDVPERARVLI